MFKLHRRDQCNSLILSIWSYKTYFNYSEARVFILIVLQAKHLEIETWNFWWTPYKSILGIIILMNFIFLSPFSSPPKNMFLNITRKCYVGFFLNSWLRFADCLQEFAKKNKSKIIKWYKEIVLKTSKIAPLKPLANITN